MASIGLTGPLGTRAAQLPRFGRGERSGDRQSAGTYWPWPAICKDSLTQISAVGWSLGGGAVLAARGQLTAAENSPLRAVVAYYPYCRDLQPWQAKVPVLSMMGAQDEVAPPEVCQRVFAQLPPGTALQARVYPEARHGFDVSDLPPYAKFGSETVGYNAGADAAAASEVEQFMSRKTD